jgi:hypothetical protein
LDGGPDGAARRALEDALPVPTVYLDPSALVLPAVITDAPEELVAPGAGDAVAHLVEAGFDVVMLGSDQERARLPELPAEVRRADALPDRLEADAWFLTGEPYPEFGRPRGGTTVLVGPRRPAGKVPLPRFDVETRDLPAAAMEILTRQAMA